MKCDQCQMLSINGVACHEFGCPNTWKTWFKDRQQWVLILKCFHCGCPFEETTPCSCREQEEDDDTHHAGWYQKGKINHGKNH